MTRYLFVPPLVLPTVGPLARAAVERGLAVVSDLVPAGSAHYYGGPLFADRVAGRLGLGLLEPADDWLPGLPPELVGRRIRAMTLDEARALSGRVFVKPPSAKSFPARVYAHGAELPVDLPDDTAVLVSEVVEFAAEFRLFVLEGEVRAGSRYATWGRLDPAPLDSCSSAAPLRAFAAALPGLPSAVVVDVGLTGPPDDPRASLVVVEANMAWFSQVYMSDPARALEVVLRAAGPIGSVCAADRSFVRPYRTPV
ncbi:ATP-grasp domain-containing protein [Saccharothrix sp. S26]|uniref:ATP-grasp domain-containing protein n=1 Tax=Saccharothrix sp. S26 TaxID=2907215 RepID=UPI001F219AB2|nr:ATP-grasp domain-containing protein [Saccharothrix sp. S26]MCE6997393.1 ATP-grasp domain-containing protein [Saccharothrix sp. S26]